MANRAKHEGTFSQRKDDIWQGRIQLAGKRQTVYGKTKREAQLKIKELVERFNAGVQAKPKNYTISEWADIWLNDHIRLEVRENSFIALKQLIKGHVKPEVGHIHLQTLRVPHVQAMVQNKLKQGLSPATVKKIRNALHAVIEYAVKMELLIRNPVKLVAVKNVDRPEIKSLSREQTQRLLHEAQGQYLYPAILLLALTGLRRSEVCGIKWSDINFEAETLYIQRAVVKCGSYNLLIHDTKTARSRRLIPLPQTVLAALKNLKETNSSSEYVFSRPNGQPIYPESIYDRLRVLGKRIGVPRINVHMLRHTAASLLLEAGENPKVVQELLGHSSISITMDIYSHVIPGMKKQAINKLSALIDEGLPVEVAIPDESTKSGVESGALSNNCQENHQREQIGAPLQHLQD